MLGMSKPTEPENPPGYDALIEAIALCDNNQRELARRLSLVLDEDVTPATITNWKKRGVPLDRCKHLEEALDGKIPRERFRPDHFRIVSHEAA